MSEELRLASFEIENWQLDSAVARNQQYPDSFEIPAESDRLSLHSGDLAKLIFEYRLEDLGDEDAPNVERMWVEVHERVGSFYLGILTNEPILAIERHQLELGSRIIFLPEHVMDIEFAADA